MRKFINFITRVANSRKFFYFLIFVFVIEASWFAICCRYPMAFDENYHFGLIKIFATQWSPFITKLPANAAAFGDIFRYDSYLYHYLMSFIYRLIVVFTHTEIAQIVILRFINIVLFVIGLVLFRKIFKRLKLSDLFTNFACLILILIPVVPFLAATINYDNLAFVMVPLTVLLTFDCRDSLIKGEISLVKTLLLLGCGMLASLVKYPFLPIFAAEVIYLVVVLIRHKQSGMIKRSAQ